MDPLFIEKYREGIVVKDYYSKKLSAERLRRCYEIAPSRVRQYLKEEVDFVLDHTKSRGRVLDLGCGYGRIIGELLAKAGSVAGVDTSMENLLTAREEWEGEGRCSLYLMDAASLGFVDGSFDTVICIQNGISAFRRDPRRLIEEALRVTRKGGAALFSTYSERFWQDRLEWFRLQSREGLLGEIDEEKTKKGVIVCKDGFRAFTIGRREFEALTSGLDARVRIMEVDASSLFCVINPL